MADTVQKIAQDPPAKQAQEEVMMVSDVPQAEKADKVVEKEPPLPENEEKPLKGEKLIDEPTTTDVSKSNPVENNVEKIPQSDSFKEESTKISDLSENERKALEDLKQLVQEALNKHELSSDLQPPSLPPKEESNPEEKKEIAEEEEQKPKEIDSCDVSKNESEESNKVEVETKVEEAKNGEEVKEKNAETLVIEEKVVADSTDDDGAKTVEAIKETIVSISPSIPTEDQSKGSEENRVVTEQTQPKEATEAKEEAFEFQPPEEISIWGIPLLADERSDVILLKFLRARDFKVKDAFFMLKNTVKWRKQFGIDELVNEDLGNDLDKVVFMHGVDKEGHPICYNVYGEFQNKELYQKMFSDEEKRLKFLRWRIQFLERSIRKLDLTPGGISTAVQVTDLKNSPGPGKWELRQATKQALQLLQDNYPEFVAKQVFINVPWWYLAFNMMISPFLTQRTKSKFVFAGPSKSAETLLRYIGAEQLPIKYGGLSKDGEFDKTESVTEITIRPSAKHTVEFPVTESCLLTWEVRVVGWGVKYGAEFVPSAEESYTVIIQKAKKIIVSSEEPVVCNSFKIGEPGKVVLTIDNPTSKKKKLLYRLMTTKSSSD